MTSIFSGGKATYTFFTFYTFFTPNSFLIALGPCYATVLFALFCIARQLPNKTGGFQIKPAVPNKTGGFQIKPAVPNKTGSFQIKPAVPNKTGSFQIEPAVPNKTGGFQINPAVTCDSYLAAATVQRSHKKTGSCQ